MQGVWQRRRALAARDEGFTLIEVVVSLTLMSVMATAALYFFVGGTRAVTQQQRAQSSVVVANQAMELAYGVSAKPSGGVSGLLVGRTQAAVAAQWTGVTSVEGMAQAYQAWDPTATSGDTPAVPLTSTTELDGITYTSTTYIGACYRPMAATATDDCGLLPGLLTAPATVPSGYARMLRVMVLVSWPASSGTCAAGACQYQVSSLVDPNTDLEWNNTVRPIAIDDTAIVEVGKTVVVDVLHNDIIGVVVTNPVQKLTVTTGTGTVTLRSDGSVQFQAPTNASGIMDFTYSLKDQAGRESNVATVHVSVTPKAVDDTAQTTMNAPIAIPVTGNDQGSPASITIVAQPAGGPVVSASGTNAAFNPNGKTGTFTFQYFLTDGSALVSNTATVTVTVTKYAAPIVGDLTVMIPAAASSPPRTTIDMVGLLGNPADYLYEVLSVSINQGRLAVNNADYNSSTNKIGTTLGYTPQANVLGVWTFQYRVLTPDKATASDIKTVTIYIMPTPVNDAFTVTRSTKGAKLNVGLNDAPMNFGGTTQFVPVIVGALGSNCGTLPASQPDAQNGILAYNAPTKAATCTFKYAIQGTGIYSTLVSAPATVTITVK